MRNGAISGGMQGGALDQDMLKQGSMPASITAAVLLATFLFGAGIVYFIASASFGAVISSVAAILSGAACALFSQLYKYPGVWRRAIYLSVILVALSLLMGAPNVIASLANAANGAIVSWDYLTDSYLLPFDFQMSSGIFAILAVVVFSIGLASLMTWVLMSVRKSAFTLFIAMFFAFWTIFNQSSSILAFCMIVVGGVAFAALQTISTRQSTSFIRDASRGFAAIIPTLLAALMLVVAVFALMLGMRGDWSGSLTIRSDVIESIDGYRFGSDTLGEGDFSKSVYMNNTADRDAPVRLRIEYSSPDDVSRSYFRGFIGSEYSGFSFEQPAFTNYIGDWNGLFTWADNLGFDPVAQNAAYLELNDSSIGSHAPVRDLTITNVDANRQYSYAPYLVESDEDASQLLDIYLLPNGFFGSDVAHVSEIASDIPDESFIPAAWVNAPPASAPSTEARASADMGIPASTAQEMGDFIQAERAYRSFVYEHYLDISDAERDVVSSFFETANASEGEEDLYTKATRIRSYLESKCIYTDAPSSYDFALQGDFVNWFLNSQKRGNSAAFAAAAVLAFRECGVPARYAEGYMITDADAANLQAAGQAVANLTEDNAHAWVEVYIDGIGFVPIEVTPGFYDKQYSAQNMIAISREVAGDGSDSNVSGSLDDPWENIIPDELKPFAWLGLILLLIILLLLAFAVLELQRYIRRKRRIRRFERALEASAEAVGDPSPEMGLTSSIAPLVSSMQFQRLKDAMRFMPIGFDASHPKDSSRMLADFTEGLSEEEYLRVIDLIERERFGSVAINAHEAALIDDVIVRIENAAWGCTNVAKHVAMRYRYLIDLPLV